MPVDAKTIQIFLPDGEPRGIRIAEITTRIVQAVHVARSRLDRLGERAEINRVGLYFLFGESADRVRPQVYIGQSEDLRGRLKDHYSKKEFWTSAVFIVSKTDNFTLVHIRYLEWLAIRRAIDAKRYSLENGNAGSKPFIPEPLEADAKDAFETIDVLLATLGFPVFEPLVGTSVVGTLSLEFVCQGPDAHGLGRLVDDGFVVLKGSRCRRALTNTVPNSVLRRRDELMSAQALTEDGAQLVFQEDVLFDSPSGAAATVLGRSANGRNEWRTVDGRSINSIEEAQIARSNLAAAD